MLYKNISRVVRNIMIMENNNQDMVIYRTRRRRSWSRKRMVNERNEGQANRKKMNTGETKDGN